MHDTGARQEHRTKRHFHHKVYDFLVPHRGNLYRPFIFYASSVMAIAVIVIAFEFFYLFNVHYLVKNQSFLASIFPAAIVGLTNDDRQAHDVGPLTVDPLLEIAAQEKAQDMAARGYFSHTTPEGNPPWFWLDKVGYAYSYAGENLAMDFSESTDVEKAWMNSPSHYANIVKPQYTRIGVGVATGKYQGRDTTFVVTFFAAPPESNSVFSAPAPEVAAASGVNTKPTPLLTRTKVLGAETHVLAAGAILATSPELTTTYFFTAILVVLIMALLLALLTRSRERYWEIAGGAIILIVLIVGLMVHNERSLPDVAVPQGASQSATISNALPPR